VTICHATRQAKNPARELGFEVKMDRRQQKTRKAVFDAFEKLIAEKKYADITVKDIIEAADIGRTTFYAHFDTKDSVLEELCAELFDHIFDEHLTEEDTHDFSNSEHSEKHMLTHILYHLKEDKDRFSRLFQGESGDIFWNRFALLFRGHLRKQLDSGAWKVRGKLPEDLYVNVYISSYIETAKWWFTHSCSERPEKVESYFEEMMCTASDDTNEELRLARQQIALGNESVLAMAKALFLKDRNTGEHCHRVAYYSAKLARAYGFSQKETDNIKKAALLHDIGKIAIPDSILKKPDRLTPEEYELMKTHTTSGAELLQGFTMVEHVSEGALYHHERYDGKGYPKGLSGKAIPLYGRIIAVADTFDAMTADRVYRNALDMEQVVSEIKNGRGTQFDPELDDIFLSLIGSGYINPKKTFEMFRHRDLTEDIN